MKTSLFIALLCLSLSCFGQNIDPAPSDKSVVYFVRPASLGAAINFTYFDSTQVIGRFNGGKYLRYECSPGTHLFWARSENKDFIEAEVEAGKIYFVEAVPKMGALKAAVRLDPVNPSDVKKMEKIMKLLKKKPSESFTPEQLQKETKDFADVIPKGMEKYNEDKAKGNKIAQLTKTMNYQNP